MNKDLPKVAARLSGKKSLQSRENRLAGADGRISVPAVPDLFYLRELFVWLVNADLEKNNYKIAQGDYKYDCLYESTGYQRIQKLPASLENATPGFQLKSPLKRIKYAAVYNGLSDFELSQPILNPEDYQEYSRGHHQFLRIILDAVKKNFGTFSITLAKELGVPVRSQDNLYEDTLKSLRTLQNTILMLEAKGSFRIPDLYAWRDHGVLMSYSLNNVAKYESERWDVLFTYRFSKKTSYHFLRFIKEMVAQHILRYENLELKQQKMPLRSSHPERTAGELIRKPTKTTEKVKLILELLGSTVEADPGAASKLKYAQLSNASLMILLRVFSHLGIFDKDPKKWHFGIAYHLLTGNGYHTFDKLYETKEITKDSLRIMSDSESPLKAKEALKSLKEKLITEVIPYLDKLEKMV